MSDTTTRSSHRPYNPGPPTQAAHEKRMHQVYLDMMHNLRGLMESTNKGKTLAGFVRWAAEKGEHFQEENLRRVFSPTHRQVISVTLYIRLCRVLAVGGPAMQTIHVPATAPHISLLDLLLVDTHTLLLSLTEIQYYDLNIR